MGQYNNLALPKGVRLVKIGKFVDERGELCFAENSALPFHIERVFWICNIPEGKTRGGHAHRICAEIVFPLNGSFNMFVSDSDGERIYNMNDSSTGIYIGPNVWCELRDFTPGTVCVVLASHPYMPDGYINNYEDFLDQ